MNRRALLALLTLGLPGRANGAPGEFSGNPVVEFDPGGRFVTLLQPFSFTDPSGAVWQAPAGWKVDGASIPKPFWSFIGGPFEGPYRDASIIHDYYCDVRSRPHEAVHRVFYDAMLARGVESRKAKLMYYAVYKFGPKWKRVTTRVPVPSIGGPPRMVDREQVVDLPRPEYDPAKVEAALQLIERDPTLQEIEAFAAAPS